MSPLAVPNAPTRPRFAEPPTRDPMLTAQHAALVKDVRHRSGPVLALERLDRAKAATCPLRDLAGLVDQTLELLEPLGPAQPIMYRHDS